MAPATHELFHAILDADASAVTRALAAGADVNATDKAGRSVVAYAALGQAIDVIHTVTHPRLSERRLHILQLISQQPTLSLYSLNAPMAWAGGVTLLGLMSWLNMPSEIACFIDFTQGLLEVNAMDDQGATPLMYAARDGNLPVVLRLLARGARPDLKDVSKRSAIQHALPHPQILYVCEEYLRHSREFGCSTSAASKLRIRRILAPSRVKTERVLADSLFFSSPTHRLLVPPPTSWFNGPELQRTFNTLLHAICCEDLDTLHNILFSPSTNDPEVLKQSLGAPLLVNFRDGTGLTLVHHAVSQRRSLSVAVLDALYSAGADVGLFSALGFSPLHHLSRTARDDKKTDKDDPISCPSVAADAHPMYAYTMHLVRDLHAPLGATDNRGETPLHAAAEHGRSVFVLRAMLDYDKRFCGKAAVREARNERGLRPVDVAKPEFLPLFLCYHQSYTSILPEHWPRSNLTLNAQTQVPAVSSYSSPHSLCSGSPEMGLAKKGSNPSLNSRSSGSSSSSGGQSHKSYLSHCTHGSHPPHHFPKLSAPMHTLPTPDPTPPGSFAGSPTSQHRLQFDVSSCALDVLYNISFCATALHGYITRHPNANNADMNTLYHLPALSDTLHFTRDLASHMFDHWTMKLESVREEFERARGELGKAESLRGQVGREVSFVKKYSGKEVGHRATAKPTHIGANPSPAKQSKPLRHADIQKDLDPPDSLDDSYRSASLVDTTVSPEVAKATAPTETIHPAKPKEELGGARVPRVRFQAQLEKEGSQDPVTQRDPARTEQSRDNDARDGARMHGWQGQDAENESMVPAGSLRKPELTHKPDESRVEGRESRSVGSVKFPEKANGPEPAQGRDVEPVLTWLQNAPIVLERVDRDLHGIVAQFALVHQSFINAHQSIAHARGLVEEAIKSREDQLSVLSRIHQRQDPLVQLTRLSPISERSLDTGHATRGHLDQLPSPTSTIDSRHIATMLGPTEEPHLLRRLLTRKITKYVQSVFDNLQKAYIWLRIVREVLGGLRHRALIEH